MNSRQKTATVLTAALLLIVGLVAAVQASSGDIEACVEKNGNLSVADANGDCPNKAESITLASGGSSGSSSRVLKNLCLVFAFVGGIGENGGHAWNS